LHEGINHVNHAIPERMQLLLLEAAVNEGERVLEEGIKEGV
jgi:hypothetical protein